MQKFLLLLFFACAVNSTLFAQQTWTGATSNDWTEASNWNLNRVPDALDDIIIPAGTENSPVVQAGSDVGFWSIDLKSGASLTVEAGATMTSTATPFETLHIEGTFINNGTISITNNAAVQWSAIVVEGGLIKNYGTITVTGTIMIGIIVESGQLFNYSGLISVSNQYGVGILSPGNMANEAGAQILIKSPSTSLHNAGRFRNSGRAVFEGDVVLSNATTTNEECATFEVKGSLRIEDNSLKGMGNAGLTVISDTLKLKSGIFVNLAILKYKTLDAGASDFLQNSYNDQNGTGSAVVSDDPALTITRFGSNFWLYGEEAFRDQEETQPAGTYEMGEFHPDPSLPLGSQTLYLKMAINDGACTYMVPFHYLVTPNTWLGTTSADWGLPANWSHGSIPGPTTNVDVPAGTPNNPVISSTDAIATARDISIAPGASLTVGDFVTLEVTGNVTNNGTFNASAAGSFVYFSSPLPQTIPGGQYFNLSVGGGNKTLTGNASVSLAVRFSGTGKIDLNSNTLTLADGVEVTSAGPGSYFITNGTGGLKKNNVGSNNFTFPIGTAGSYTPVILSNSGDGDNFTVSVGEGAYSSYINNVPQGSAVTSMTVNKTWYVSEDLPGGSNVRMTTYWNATDELPTFNRNLSFISHYINNAWNPGSAAPAAGTGPYYISRLGITSFSPFAVTNPGSPLPVTLSRFDAVREGNAALLSWATTSETNSDRFEVERSINGKDWENIGVVSSAGDSKELVAYHFVDLHPLLFQENLYRLRMIDRATDHADGAFSYSRIRSLSFAGSKYSFVYPNPTTDRLFVQDFRRVLSTQITYMNGKVFHRSGRMNDAGIDVSTLPEGLYLMEISWADGQKTVQRVIVLKHLK